MRTRRAFRRTGRGAAATLLLVLAGCVGAGPGAGHEAGSGHRGWGDGGHHAAGQHSGDFADALLRTGDLPEGYTSGGHHHVPPAARPAAPPVPEGCAAIAELIGEHPSVRQTARPQVGVSFSKSHFGPQLSQTLIDVGGFAEAAAARERVAAAVGACDRYVQSTSSIGATTYRVTSLPSPPGAEDGVYFRLDAVGSDFTGISWDVWAHDCEGTLMAVAFRSAKNGDNDDFWAATHAAMDRMHPGTAW